MKRLFSCLICVLFIVGLFAGCSKEPEEYSEWISYYEVVSESDDASTEKDIPEASLQSSPEPEKIKYESSVPTPKYVNFYKGGMWAESKDKSLNRKIAKHIENWFYDYTQDNLPVVDMEVTPQFIWETRLNETVIELDFNLSYDEKLNFLGKINLERHERLFIPLTGEYAYYLFSDNGIIERQNKPYNLKGSGLEKFFEGIKLDKKVKDWQSTVIAPTTVTFYKDGATAVSTDKELNHKIAKHIEEWFKYNEGITASKSAGTIDDLLPIKQNEMAIELKFDGEINLYGGVIYSTIRTLFIPVTGKGAGTIYEFSEKNPYRWSGPIAGGGGLEQYFDYVQFTPLTEEERRWRSTVSSASSIKAYEGAKLLGESGGYNNYTFNYEVMQHIEKWFYHKEEIKRADTGITDVNLSEIRAKEKYLEIYLGSPDPTFYGQYVISEKSSCILIPLTGKYAYHIFEGDYKNYSPTAIITEGSGLEKYFEVIKSKGVNDDPQDLYEIDSSIDED